ncbi:hypothetical protein SPI_03363 [Niveomyces insectorum RCEF 264]|uniref:Mmc1 C-terminal domain-containing protein n=1 Tax=Niveomyces insectorum RCEF 264 TaxID=1081102 RepID=A0A167XA67_9HYPO|nr:hypothetical protein SPI_03363 [Niveomyces insectorum RCEF 264]
MPPRLRLRLPPGPAQILLTRSRIPSRPPACLFCSLQCARPRPPSFFPGKQPLPTRRAASTATAAATRTTSDSTVPESTHIDPQRARTDLVAALDALQKHDAGPRVLNLSRIQLAIRGLQQAPGHEAIRVAVLGLTNNSSNGAGDTAKELLRLLLADPLKEEEPWEAQLAAHDARQPLIVRVRGHSSDGNGDAEAGNSSIASHHQQQQGVVTFATESELAEIEVESPGLAGHQIEFLVMESNLAVPAAAPGYEGSTETWEETVLVPTVEIPLSQTTGANTGRYTPVTTPVHLALIVADGLLGAASLATMPLRAAHDADTRSDIRAAVNLPHYNNDDMASSQYPFATCDTAAAADALALFRSSVAHAHAYETRWRTSGVSGLAGWLKAGARDRTDGSTKPPVRQLVASVLRNALTSIQAAEAAQLQATAKTARTAGSDAQSDASLHTALADWAEAAHGELQAQLDRAFAGRRWRQLRWWKLFWRADDVTMLATGLVTQRFLPEAERSVVYLAGRIEEAARRERGPAGTASAVALYAAPVVATEPTSPASAVAEASSGAEDSSVPPSSPPPPPPKTQWPTHIAFTRRYLLDETVPALQALAQKLVLQTVGSSGLAAALAGLTYLSAMGAYEAGAVAALGLVWSLARMQKKWEAARQFWEGEVREEGRKAVRAAEASVAATLDETRAVADAAAGGGNGDRKQTLRDLRETRALVERAQEASKRLK